MKVFPNKIIISLIFFDFLFKALGVFSRRFLLFLLSKKLKAAI